ncbi:uncharacterized protein LOC106369533 [Brassica napus]|uniref:(rape) hypothetical protein n=1 Tax=Brassica napus TaxID=3708 RepID=A0A816J6R3_BRANA|nr:uncharacterized protein LOC106369533 [Brassica napus]CAF1789575.1 unnamed protein product [Brassica napus]
MNPSESSSLGGKQPSLRRSLSTPTLCGGGSTAAEFCGGTTAGCAALCCCAPCSVVSLVVFAVYKAPRRICRGAIRRVRRRRRGMSKKEVSENGDCEKKLCKAGSSQFAVHPLESKEDGDLDKLAMYLSDDEEEDDDEVIALEKEMWNRFNSGGFWRAETASCRLFEM